MHHVLSNLKKSFFFKYGIILLIVSLPVPKIFPYYVMYGKLFPFLLPILFIVPQTSLLILLYFCSLTLHLSKADTFIVILFNLLIKFLSSFRVKPFWSTFQFSNKYSVQNIIESSFEIYFI